MRAATGRWLGAVIVASVVVRLGAAIGLGNEVVPLPGTWDQVSYDALARRVAGGHGFSFAEDWWPLTRAGEPTAHWSYLYTLWLAGVYALQAAAVGVVAPWLTWRLGRRVAGDRVAVVAAAMCAGYLYFVYYAAALVTESAYVCGVLASLESAAMLADRLSQPAAGRQVLGSALVLGACLAVTVLLRQVFLLVVPLLAVWLIWAGVRAEGRRGGLRAAGALLPAFALLALAVAPFTAYNHARFGRFVLLNTNAGFAFYWGNHPIHGTSFQSILPDGGPSYASLIPDELRGLDEASLERELLARGLATVRADPWRYVVLSLDRSKDFFKFWPSRTSSAVSNLARILSFGLLLPLLVAGLRPTLAVLLGAEDQGRRVMILLLAFALAYTLVHLLTWTLIRYRLPVDAVLLVVGALGLDRCAGWLGLWGTEPAR